jgi:hypothetical protein
LAYAAGGTSLAFLQAIYRSPDQPNGQADESRDRGLAL